MTFQSITYAGHSAFFIDTDSIKIAIDPWLEGNPVCPDELKNPASLDLIILTHGHADHASDASRLAKATGAKIAATYELAMIMTKEGVAQDKIIPMNKGGSVTVEDITVSLTHAHHSSSYDTADSTLYAGEACGVVISDGSTKIYHAGDTALFMDMQLIKEQYQPSIAILPIGDHFTMGQKEAAKAAKIVGAKTNIPMHYKTFELLEQNADEFKKECAGYNLEVAEIEIGASLSL